MTACKRATGNGDMLPAFADPAVAASMVVVARSLFPNNTAKGFAAATDAAVAPPHDYEEIVAATVRIQLQQESKGSGNSAEWLVASVRERTPATGPAVSALMYEALTYRLHRLQRLLRMQHQHQYQRYIFRFC